MAWEFLRRILHVIGSKIMTKLAPRLIFFQYTNLITQELDEEQQKYRIYQIRSVAENEIHRLKMRKTESKGIGLSTVKDHSTDSTSEASIFDVHDHHDFSDTETVYSNYFEDERDHYEFI